MSAYLSLDARCERFFEEYPFVWKDIGADYPRNPHEVIEDVVERKEHWEMLFERRAFWWRRTADVVKNRLNDGSTQVPDVYSRKDREVAGTALLVFGLLYGEFGRQGASPVVKLMRSPPPMKTLRPLTDEHFRQELVNAINTYVAHWSEPLVAEYERLHQPDIERHDHDVYRLICDAAEAVHIHQPGAGHEFHWELAKMKLFNERAKDITGQHFDMTPDHYRYCSRIVSQRNGWRGPEPADDVVADTA